MVDTDSTLGDLTGHVTVITGGNSGIGFGIAQAMAQAGARIAIWARDTEKNAGAAKELMAAGAEVHTAECDVTDPEQLAWSLAGTVERFGRLDSCFAAAGTAGQSTFAGTSPAEFHRVVQVNLEGTFLTFQTAARHMIDNGGGSLVAISSISGLRGQALGSQYAASKAGVLALAKSVAVELARHRIRVNAMVPGWIDTPMTSRFRRSERFTERMTGRTPVRRWGEPSDLGRLAVYLAAPEPLFHTGSEIVIDGGYTLS
ncbi:SDR family NAD(P)-dependent oxidoreductase [Amycolatopsis sp. NPDC059027]|uniref:SDR family NAD(P)-dependent oxidoreductase n=1 Tax=unclassified Amycolatopsis TaxID=2618356 RepID=UPI003672ABCE